MRLRYQVPGTARYVFKCVAEEATRLQAINFVRGWEAQHTAKCSEYFVSKKMFFFVRKIQRAAAAPGQQDKAAAAAAAQIRPLVTCCRIFYKN